MGLEALLPKIFEGATPLNLIPIVIAGYFIVRELNSYYDMKAKVHKYDSDIIGLTKDVENLKKQLEKLDNEHQELHPRKGGKYH